MQLSILTGPLTTDSRLEKPRFLNAAYPKFVKPSFRDGLQLVASERKEGKEAIL
jgi:hypothetical protein